MRRLHALHVSESDTTRGVEPAESPGLTSMPPRADMAPRRGLLRVDEAAVWLGLSKRTMYELLSRGEIPSVQIGRSRRIAFAALERFVERLSAAAGGPDARRAG